MKKDSEIVRTIQIEDKTIHVHIHLSEDEVRRLLLPHIANAFADELRRSTFIPRITSSNSTVPIKIDPFLPHDSIKVGQTLLTNIGETEER